MALDQVKDLLGVLADAGLVERQGIEGGRPGAFVLASRLRVPSVLRRPRERDETLLDLDREPGAADLAALDRPASAELGGWIDDVLAGPEAADVGADDPSSDRPGGHL